MTMSWPPAAGGGLRERRRRHVGPGHHQDEDDPHVPTGRAVSAPSVSTRVENGLGDLEA